jgi:hypothetical protein
MWKAIPLFASIVVLSARREKMGECGGSGPARTPINAELARIRTEPPVGFEPTTFALQDRKEA